ncbi:hypothetical protein LR48_Vigan03g096400 [Vigna angularis]|uniref:Transposase-associated domain-containing protein n=1 Tax=Phaseolus angularis TaxID=3914 RepID=A0A0L9U4I9_PHAAN|nr:hypothetical protein LR48_Vigan03g096400 [Vigna angularis]
MTREGSERRDKGKGVARPKKRQRQAPKYVLRVPATLPISATLSPSSVGPSPTPAIHPPPTPAANILPPVIITLTPPPVIITPTAPPDPTFIPSSSSIPSFETATPSADPDLAGDGDGVDPPLHDRPWIEPYGKGYARNAGERPYWLGEHIWNSLLAHWNSAEFCNKCATGQRNRAFEKGDTLHTGGSITVHEHVIRMAQALGRAVHVDEVFAKTDVQKGTNQFVDERSQKTHEEFSTRLSHIRSEHGSASTPDDATNEDDDICRTQCWVDVVGGKKKGRVYGAGQLATNYTTSRGGTLKHQPSSSTTTAEETIERLTQLLQQRDQENHDLRENYNDLRTEFTNFKSLVMRALPDASDIHSTVPPTQPRPSLSPVVPQQPTSVQPTSSSPHQSSPHQSSPHQSSHL